MVVPQTPLRWGGRGTTHHDPRVNKMPVGWCSVPSVVARFPNGRIWAGTVIHSGKLAGGRVAPFETETVSTAFETEAHKLAGEGFALVVDPCSVAPTVVHPLFQVGANPWTSAASASIATPRRIPKINCLHSTTAVILVVGL